MENTLPTILEVHGTVIRAAENFYIKGVPTGISDEIYDNLRIQLIDDTGHDVFQYIKFDLDAQENDEIAVPFTKEMIDNDFRETAAEWEANAISPGCFWLPKYDGGSCIAYYSPRGLQEKILSTPSSDFGFDQTCKLRNHFPKRVTPGIRSIQAEALVDLNFKIPNVRNKANGLINSKDMQEDVDDYLTIRGVKVVNYDDVEVNAITNALRLKRLPTIVDAEGRVLFQPAQFIELHQIPKDMTEDPVILKESEETSFLVDGYVFVDDNGYKGLKFYYTEYLDVPITSMEWPESAKGNFSPVAAWDTVLLTGKKSSGASLNGVGMLVDMKAGAGALVRIIMSGGTIPQILEVLEPSEDYEFPECPHCGTQLNLEDSLFGPAIKCHNTECSKKVDSKYDMILDWWEWDETTPKADFEQSIEEHVQFYSGEIMGIERWKPENKLKEETNLAAFGKKLLLCIQLEDFQGYIDAIKKAYVFTDLQEETLDLHAESAFIAIRKVYNLINK